MNFDAESFNCIAEGDRLFSKGLECKDWTMKRMLLAEARRCYIAADYMSIITVIDRVIGRDQAIA